MQLIAHSTEIVTLEHHVCLRLVPHIKLATRISGHKYGQIPGYVRKRQANTGLMVKLSGWTQRRLREMGDAAVDAWLRVRRRRHLNRAPRDFSHAKKRKRVVWKDRVDSLTDAEFLRAYRMTLETFTQVCTDITRKAPKKSRRDLHGVVPAELQLLIIDDFAVLGRGVVSGYIPNARRWTHYLLRHPPYRMQSHH